MASADATVEAPRQSARIAHTRIARDFILMIHSPGEEIPMRQPPYGAQPGDDRSL